MRYVNRPIEKIDGMSLVKGKPVYTNDIAPKDCLIVMALRSPHAFAKIVSIDTKAASLVKGVECILTYKDVPHTRFTRAGQSYPEPSAYDTLILDEYVRYIGDEVALVAATNERAAKQALRLIKVEYEVLEPVLDFRKSETSGVVIHPEEDYQPAKFCGTDVQHNVEAFGQDVHGDVDAEFAASDIIVDETYTVKAQEQSMMESFRTYTYLDYNDRLVCVTSTQVPFHVRRQLARALEIPKSRIRVIKPRIGGGFGAKQTVISEFYPAIVTLKTGKPAKMIYTRKETFVSGDTRHQMQVNVKIGANKDGHIRAIEVSTLSNQGAYGEHGSTTIGLSGHKSISLYQPDAFRFNWKTVYTNLTPAGAFRGYGATQGIFAVESGINELAKRLDMDSSVLREMNMVRFGQIMPSYYGEPLTSTALDRCIVRGKEMIEWDRKFPRVWVSDKKVRAVGMALGMQGSCITKVDVASAEIRLNDSGFYTLKIGATDMGTGADTILTQIAAETLLADMDKFIVAQVDTDISPFDTGSYASSTTYVTGMAVFNASNALKDKIIYEGARMINPEKYGDRDNAASFNPKKFFFTGDKVIEAESNKFVTVEEIAIHGAANIEGNYLNGTGFYSGQTSPPPLMAGFAEIELDLETGKYDLIDYAAVVDCGTVINPALARVQAEGGIGQGIGLAMFEDVQYSSKGKMMTDSFMQYKIPSRKDFNQIRVDFESSYEPSGPYGAKSIGEIVINTPAPAIADALRNAVGINMHELPMTPEKVLMAINALKDNK